MNILSLYDIAKGLGKVKWRGDKKFSACCPSHDDRTPSFSATDAGGKILVKCFSGCSQAEVIEARSAATKYATINSLSPWPSAR
jgi:DNA primase